MQQQTGKPVIISKQALRRMPYYLQYLRNLCAQGISVVSAPAMAADLGLNEVQVRKDLAAVSTTGGRPKTGFAVHELLQGMERFLGYTNVREAVLVGAGALGKALLSYQGFAGYGLQIVAAFDHDPAFADGEVGGVKILPEQKIASLCERLHIKMGIIAVPAAEAQAVCDQLVAGGVLAVWNFAPTYLRVPPEILVQNEDMAASLVVLSKHLKQDMQNR